MSIKLDTSNESVNKKISLPHEYFIQFLGPEANFLPQLFPPLKLLSSRAGIDKQKVRARLHSPRETMKFNLYVFHFT